jgi:hypothetical protein
MLDRRTTIRYPITLIRVGTRSNGESASPMLMEFFLSCTGNIALQRHNPRGRWRIAFFYMTFRVAFRLYRANRGDMQER